MIFAEATPDLVSWFDNNKNNFSIDDVAVMSRKIAFWKCPKGHSFKKKVADFSRTPICRVCKVKSVFDNKGILKEWDKSNPDPTTVSLNDNRNKRLWVCKKGHKWSATPWSRNKKGSGCPDCNKGSQTSKIEMRFYTELKSLFSEVYSDYKIGKLKYDIYIKEINLLIEYDGYHWHRENLQKDVEKNNNAKVNGYGILRIREPDLQEINNSLKINRRLHILEHDIKIEINLLIDYILKNYDFDFVMKNKLLNYLKENMYKNNLEYNEILSNRILKKNLKDNESAYKYFDYSANHPIKPESISPKTSAKYLFCCSEYLDHKWEDTPLNLSRGTGCPFCSNKRVSETNRLSTNYPKILKYWDFKNNVFEPKDLTCVSRKKIKFNCVNCKSPFIKQVNSMTQRKISCQKCKHVISID